MDSKQIVAYSEGLLNDNQQLVLNYIIEIDDLMEAMYMLSSGHGDTPNRVSEALDEMDDASIVEVLEGYVEYKEVF